MRYDLNGQVQVHKAKAVYGGKIHAVAADGTFEVGGQRDQKRKRWQNLSLFTY